MLNLAAFISYVAVATFTPGPSNILAMTNASQYGFKKTLHFMAGAGTGFLIVFSASAYFNLLLFNIIPKTQSIIGLIGAAYMIYLAVKIMKSKPSDSEIPEEPLTFRTGIALQFVNPKFLIYAITITSNFIVPYFSSIYYIPFTLLMTTIGISSLVVWALFGTVFKRFLSRYFRSFNIAMGLLLLYSAAAISGLTHLFQ